MNPSSAIEDYLECILNLEKKEVDIRTMNIAECLNIKPPSVVKMVRKMVDRVARFSSGILVAMLTSDWIFTSSIL